MSGEGDGRSPFERKRSPRRWMLIILGLLAGFVVYAFTVEKTEVDLSQIRDETRREQLFRIVRALANPDLVTYDQAEVLVSTEVFVPCGPDLSDVEPSEPYIVVTPACGSPGDEVTIEGFGFVPGAAAGVDFVPDSEFAVTLQMARFETDADGRFSVTAELPSRESPNPQQIQATTRTRLGTWTDRVSAWTDANDNGVEDDGVIPADGDLEVQVVPGRVQTIGSIALVDEEKDLVQFIGFGNSAIPRSGPAQGEIPTVVDVELTQEFTEDITGAGSKVFLSATALGATTPAATISGPPGTDLSDWTLIVYDADELNRFGRTPLGDLFAMSPRLSENALDTWDKIIETVALALLATTVGTALAIPLSFLSARNLMRDITTPVANLSLYLLAVPAGIAGGAIIGRSAGSVATALAVNSLVALAGVVSVLFGIMYSLRWAMPTADTGPPTPALRAARYSVIVLAGFLGIVGVYFFADLSKTVGAFLRDVPAVGFIGNFIATIGEVLEAILVFVGAVLGAGVLVNLAGRLSYTLRSRLPARVMRVLNLSLATAAGVLLAVLIGRGIDWLYQVENPTRTVWIPSIVGGSIGLLSALRAYSRESVNVGLTLYYSARTLFNTLRSIEPLVMGIVFVVWVGFGPFAGSLALALHTTAALAKLYSEQVESISAGPIEAVRATGATRLQTVVYAVVPQIVPPYISFTMYRWDINVRMSTIIGFVGGGGIGFLLQQNINLLQYRAAAAQMLAIAIVVASMDYISARIRERLV